MTKNKYSLIKFALVTLCVTACTHKVINQNQQTASNVPAVNDTRTPANARNYPADEVQRLVKIIQAKDSLHFNQMLAGILRAQTLISSFDQRLNKATSEKHIDQIYESELYCKIMEVRNLFENSEEDLAIGIVAAKNLGNDAESWYYQQISDYAKGSPLQKIAMMNVFRGFMDTEMEICGTKDCVAKDLDKISSFDFDPRDNERLNAFVKSNQSYNSNPSAMQTANDMKPGKCFATTSASKRKPQSEGYDWVNRNWVGSVLPVGHFVFTYDDGPHATYTRDIRDTWAKAGLAKPAFFWLRKNASALSEIVKELNQQGYVIGSHSERHGDLGNLAKSGSVADLNGVNRNLFAKEIAGLTGQAYLNWKTKTLDREINQSVADLSTILGKPVRYFRLPYGSGVRNDLIGARFQALNLDHFFWRVDSLDWQDKNPASIRDRVVTQMNTVKKGIILFHDIHPQSAAAAKLMADYFVKNPSVKAVPISDLPGLKP